MKNFGLFLILMALWSGTSLYGQDLCYEHIELASVINILDAGEEVWMVTRGDGAYRYDKNTEEIEQFTEGVAGMTSDYCNDLLLYEGQLLLSTDTLVLTYVDDQFEIFIDELGGALGISAEGRLIVAGGEKYTEWEDGVLYYQKEFFELTSQGLNLSCGICDTSTDVAIDAEGTVWINHFGFYEFDILSYDGNTWSVFDWGTEEPNVFPIESFNYTNQILFHEGSIWATSWIGLNQRIDEQWTLYHNPYLAYGITDGLDTMKTHPIAMTADWDGKLWVGSVGDSWNLIDSELAVMDDNGWEIYQGLPDLHAFNCIVPSATDSDILFAGTTAGLSIIDKNCLTSSLADSDIPQFEMIVDQGYLLLSNYLELAPESYAIYDARGVQVLTGKLDPVSHELDLSDLSPGFHSIVLQATDRDSARSFVLNR